MKVQVELETEQERTKVVPSPWGNQLNRMSRREKENKQRQSRT